MTKLELVQECYLGARSGDHESYQLFVDGKQWFFPSGASAGRTEGEILKAFIKDYLGFELITSTKVSSNG